MYRVVVSLVAIPLLQAVLLAAVGEIWVGNLGSVNAETFELGMLPIVALFFFEMLIVFLPLLLLTSRFVRLTPWNSAAVGSLSGLLPFVAIYWTILSDVKLRPGFRMERLADNYPWLILGALGGLLFWLLAVNGNRVFSNYREKRS